jgi:hypothetical protein
MFVTLRRNEDSLSIERKDFAPSHQACENCRAKKMRCSGQRRGCHRCLTRGLSCRYAYPVNRSGQQRQRISSKETLDPSPSDGRIATSSAPQTACRSLTPSSESFSQESNRHLGPHSTLGNTSVTSIQPKTDILGMGSHASAVSKFSCDFVAPYAPLTQQSRLSTDDMFTSISATASDALTRDSPSCLLLDTRGPTPSIAQWSPSMEEHVAPKPCQCVSSMLSLLEESEIEGERLALGTIDHFLRLNKHGLARCNRVLGCQECCLNSKLVMLIIAICRTMATQHERMYKILVRQYEKLQRLVRQTQPILNRGNRVNPAEPASEAPDAPVLTMGIVAFNDYEVDACEEPCVFGSLATMQQRALVRFMAQLRLLCVRANWQIHRDMLVALEKRVKEQLERGRTYHENNEG